MRSWYLLSPLVFLFLALTATAADKPARLDANGDPLPEGALMRLGTTRFRLPALVFSVALSPDGKTLALGGWGDPIRLLDAKTGKVVRELQPQSGRLLNVMHLEFSSNGKVLAAAGDVGPVYLWDPATGKVIAEIARERGSLGAFALSGDGKRLVTGTRRGEDPARACVFEIATGKQIAALTLLSNGIPSTALSSDGKLLATAGEFFTFNAGERAKALEVRETIQLWDVASAKELGRLRLEGGCRGLAFAPDGKSLVAVTGSREVAVLAIPGGKELRRFAGQEGYGMSLVFSPDGSAVAIGHDGGMVQVSNLVSGKRLGVFEAPRPEVRVGYRPDGKLLALTRDHEAVQVWDVLAGKELTPPGGHRAGVSGLAFTSGGKELVSLSNDGGACRWDAATGRSAGQVTLRDKDGPWAGLVRYGGTWLSPDGKHALAVKHSSELRLYELSGGRQFGSFRGMSGPSTSAAFSPNGALLAAGSQDAGKGALAPGIIRVIDVNTGKELHRLQDHKGEVVGLAFSPDSQRLASVGRVNAGRAGELYLWDAWKGKALWHTDGFQTRAAAFSPDGRLLATEDRNGVTLWEAATGRQLRVLMRESGAVMTFSPDNRLLLLARHDGHAMSLGLYEVATGKARQAFTVPGPAAAGAAAFSPNGRRLATGLSDTTILLWDLKGPPDGDKPQEKPTAEELDKLWTGLDDPDARVGWKAMRRLEASPGEAVALLAKHLKPAESKSAPADVVARLIAALDSDSFGEREKAAKELGSLGKSVEGPLKKALADKPSAETRRYIEELLEKLKDNGSSPDLLRPLRAIKVLEDLGTPQGRTLLETLAKGRAEAPATTAAKEALERLDRAAKP